QKEAFVLPKTINISSELYQ
ncbi:hypothetical protein MGSAQ_001402, partial [marine sediment metagenome]